MRNSYRESHFTIWKNRIEIHLQNVLPNIKLDDLPDEPYRNWFEDSPMTPYQVSQFILERNGFYF